MANLTPYPAGNAIGVNMNLLWPTGASSTFATADIEQQSASAFQIKVFGGAYTLLYLGTGFTYTAVPGGVQVTGGVYNFIRLLTAVGTVCEVNLSSQNLAAITNPATPATALVGADTINGGDVADTLFGVGGVDGIFAGGGNDFISGGEGIDNLQGGTGDDTLVFAAPSETMDAAVNGGAGSDTVLVTGPGAYDFRPMGSNFTSIERYVFQHAFSGASISVAADQANAATSPLQLVGSAQVDAFNVYLPNALSTFSAAAWSVTDFTADVDSIGIYAFDFVDFITGTTFADAIVAGNGDDTVNGGAGGDFIFGGKFEAGGGFAVGSGRDTLNGGAGDDRMWGADDSDALNGGDGNDVLTGGAASDSLNGGFGDDLIFGGEFLGVGIAPGSGNDAIDAGEGRDAIYGFDGDDQILTGGGDDYVEGGDGGDVIAGGAGNSFLQGGAGADAITGGGGFDYLYGNAGADLFNFRRGDGYDWVLDFSAAQGDRLRLDLAFGITSFAQFLAAIVTGAGFTQLTVNGGLDQITIFGIGTGQWTAGMVEFV